VTHVEPGIVPGAGHFTQEEAPGETWRLIARFARL
jgi:pimeloyl-ACP methyl ester carboxylesterase